MWRPDNAQDDVAAVHFQEFVTESLGTVFAVEVVPALGEARNPLWFELCPCRDDKFVVRRRVDSVDKSSSLRSWSTQRRSAAGW